MAVSAICRMAPDCRTIRIIYPEDGVHAHAFPFLGSNNQWVIASNQNSMAESFAACLGLGSDWSECWGKSESKSEPTTTKRFKFVDDNDNLQEGFCTARSTKWVLKNLQAWKDAINLKFPNYPVPENLLKSTDESVLCSHCSFMPSKWEALLESYINKVVLLKCSYTLSAKLKNMCHDTGIDGNKVTMVFMLLILHVYRDGPSPCIREDYPRKDWTPFFSSAENIWTHYRRTTQGSVNHSVIIISLRLWADHPKH